MCAIGDGFGADVCTDFKGCAYFSAVIGLSSACLTAVISLRCWEVAIFMVYGSLLFD